MRRRRAVRLPRAPDDDSARRGLVGRYRRRSPPRPGPPGAAGGDQRRILADGDASCVPAPSSAGACSTRASTAAGTRASWCSRGSSCSRIDSCGEVSRARNAGCAARFQPATRQDVARRDAASVPAVVRRDHARRGRERPGPAHHPGSLEAERGNTEPARSAAGGGRGSHQARCCSNVEDCYRDGDSLRNLFVRPNQIFLTNANRADVFFKAPGRRRRQGLHDLRAGISRCTPTTSISACRWASLRAAAASRPATPRRSTSSSATSASPAHRCKGATSTS